MIASLVISTWLYMTSDAIDDGQLNTPQRRIKFKSLLNEYVCQIGEIQNIKSVTVLTIANYNAIEFMPRYANISCKNSLTS